MKYWYFISWLSNHIIISQVPLTVPFSTLYTTLNNARKIFGLSLPSDYFTKQLEIKSGFTVLKIVLEWAIWDPPYTFYY